MNPSLHLKVACLLQGGDPVSYISQTLSTAERIYEITEREALRSLWAMGNLGSYYKTEVCYNY